MSKKKNNSNGSSFLIIGSRKYKKSTVNALIEESKKVFEKVLFVPVDKIQIQTSSLTVGLYYKGTDLLSFDAIYPRLSSKDYLIGEPILKIIGQSNAYCPVNLQSFQITNHKYYTSQRLSNQGVPGIVSTLFISPKYASLSIQETGYPVVMKLISGFAGKGVVLINDEKQLNSILDAVHLFEEFISTQRFVKNDGTDLRCYVVGKNVVSVRRRGAKGDWRANVSRGGTAEVIETTQEMKEISLSAANTLGVDICAVDLMESQKGLVVIEVNFMPGPFKAFLGTKMIQEWVSFIKKKVSN